MWYTAAKVEVGNTKVGTIFVVSKTKEGEVLARRAKCTSHPVTFKTVIVPTDEIIRLTVSAARHRFIKPSKDIDDIVEESIMLYEGAYC